MALLRGPVGPCICNMCIETVKTKKNALVKYNPDDLRYNVQDFLADELDMLYDLVQLLWQKRCADVEKILRKKSREQRRKLIAGIDMPEMAMLHRQDFEFLRDEILSREEYTEASDSRSDEETDQDIGAFYYPHINPIDLSDLNKLLLFLGSRCTTPPQSFLWLDLLNANIDPLGHENPYEDMVMFMDGPNIDEYCKVADPSTIPDHKFAFSPVVGHAVLCIQRAQLKIVRKILTTVLSGSSDTCQDDEHLTQLPNQELRKTIGASQQWSSMYSIASEAPYRTPKSIDLDSVIAGAQGARDAALSRTIALRDPQRFIEMRKEWSTHMLSRDDAEQGDLGEINAIMFEEAFIKARRLEEVLQSLHKLKKLLYNDDSTPKPPSEELYVVLGRLVCLINETTEYLLARYIKVGLPASPSFWDKCEPKEGARQFHHASTLPNLSEYKLSKNATLAKKKVWELFDALVDPKKRELYGPFKLATELQRLCDTEEGFRTQLTDWLQHQFADIATLLMLLEQIKLIQPAEVISRKHEGGAFALKQQHSSWTNRIRTSVKSFKIDPRHLGMSTSVDGLSTSSNIEQLKKFEAMMGQIFDNLRQDLKLQEMDLPIFEELLFHMSSRPMPSDSTGEVEEITQQLKDLGITEEQQKEAVVAVSDADIEKAFKERKPKEKTRGIAHPPQQDHNAGEADQDAAPAPEVVKIPMRKKPRNIMLQIMAKGAMGQCSFTGFRQGMAAAGFASRSSGGSNWHFQDEDSGAVYMMHEPHGRSEGSMPKYMMWDAASEFERRFGWTVETFVAFGEREE